MQASLSCFVFAILFAVVNSYATGRTATCTQDSNCGGTSGEVYCRFLSGYNPSCANGYCDCASGYIFDVNKCVLLVTKAIGDSCITGAKNETIPYGTQCAADSTVKCLPFHTQSGSICNPDPMAAYKASCDVNPQLRNKTCNDSAGMSCQGSPPACLCVANTTYYSTSDNACITRTYGSPCNNTDECRSTTFPSPLSFACNSGSCGCATGYTHVTRQDLPIGSTTTVSLDICLKGYTADVASNSSCTLIPESSADNGASVCASGLICLDCPGEAGQCRTYSSSSAANRLVLFNGFLIAISAVLALI